MNKKILRKEILKKRAELSQNNIIEYSEIIANKLYKSNAYKDAKTIMSFISFSDEVHTHEIIKEAIHQGKTVVVPVPFPETKEMKVSHILDFSELEIGHYNILSPKKEFLRFVEPRTIDLILVPGVVFARNGYRIGYGGGYYDRFFSKLEKNLPKIGLSYDLQIVDEVPTDEFDIPIDFIITEKEMINCSKKEI